MKYVHVEGSALGTKERTNMALAAINQSKNCLISLIGGLRQKNFGLDTLFDVAINIAESKEQIGQYVDYELYIDSGGYSIIKGDVESSKVKHFIECYTEYSVQYVNLYDYIFSLDIPFFGKEDDANTKSKIESYNRLAMQYMLESFYKYPQLQEKTFFVWHFKMPTQNTIWQNMYDDMGLKNAVKKRAIGGLVSLREILKINERSVDCSPFTHIAFKLLLDHFSSPYAGKNFYLHFLGVNLLQDRFQIALLEKLFTSFMGKDSIAIHSYDSIHFTYQAIMKSRDFFWVKSSDDNISIVSDLSELPKDDVDKIYVTEKLKENFYSALEKLKSNKKLEDSSIFVPLNVYNNMKIDKYFLKIIEENDIINLMTTSNSHIKLLSQIKLLLDDLRSKSPTIITEHFTDEVFRNISRTYDLMQSMNSSNPNQAINGKLLNFIEEMNFPDLIQE